MHLIKNYNTFKRKSTNAEQLNKKRKSTRSEGCTDQAWQYYHKRTEQQKALLDTRLEREKIALEREKVALRREQDQAFVWAKIKDNILKTGNIPSPVILPEGQQEEIDTENK